MRTNYRAQGARLSTLKRPDGKEIQKGGDTCTRVADSVARVVKNLPTMWETQVRSLGWEDSLEKEMATHSSILAWEIPWTEEPGGLQSKGL